MTEATNTDHAASPQALIAGLVEALEEALLEIEYHHSDMLSEDERHHPRGSGWARVYDKGRAAIAKAPRRD